MLGASKLATFQFVTFSILALLYPHTVWSAVPSFFFFFTDYVERRAIYNYIYDFYLPSVNWGAWDRYPLLLASGYLPWSNIQILRSPTQETATPGAGTYSRED